MVQACFSALRAILPCRINSYLLVTFFVYQHDEYPNKFNTLELLFDNSNDYGIGYYLYADKALSRRKTPLGIRAVSKGKISVLPAQRGVYTEMPSDQSQSVGNIISMVEGRDITVKQRRDKCIRLLDRVMTNLLSYSLRLKMQCTTD